MLVVQTLSYKHGPKVPTQLFEFCYPQTKGASYLERAKRLIMINQT